MKSDTDTKPAVRFPITERPVSRASVVVNDAFDWLVTYHGGHVAVCLGTMAIAVSVAGYYRLLPQPFSAPIFPPRCIGCNQLTILAETLLRGGMLIIVGGLSLLSRNRRARARLRAVNGDVTTSGE